MALGKAALELLGTQDYTDDIINAKVEAHLAEFQKVKTDLEAAQNANTELTTQNGELTKKAAMGEVGEAYLKELREQVEAKYKLLRGENAKEDMLSVIRTADVVHAKAMLGEYSAELEEKLPGVCSECGKKATLTRRSSEEVHQAQAQEASASDYHME